MAADQPAGPLPIITTRSATLDVLSMNHSAESIALPPCQIIGAWAMIPTGAQGGMWGETESGKGERQPRRNATTEERRKVTTEERRKATTEERSHTEEAR